MKVWSKWLSERVAECRPVSAEDFAYQRPAWELEYRREIEAAADRRECIPARVARSYARLVQDPAGACRNLRAAANADDINAWILAPRRCSRCGDFLEQTGPGLCHGCQLDADDPQVVTP